MRFIEYDKQPKQFLKKLDKPTSKRIMDKIDFVFEDNFVPHNAKKIIGEHGIFRIRIGKYRILYRINYKDEKIIVLKLGKRSQVYE